MKKYVIALATVHDGTNTLNVVHADSELEALQEFLDVKHIDNIEEILDLCFDGGLIVSHPVLLNDLVK